MRYRSASASLVWIVFLALHLGQDRQPRPDPVIQPVSFSHKLHIEAGFDCLQCHRGAEKGVSAGLPSVADCLICHRTIAADRPEIVKVKAYAADKKEIPWVRIYRLPYFVFFSHKAHLQAGADCQDCHGPVGKREVLWKEKDISMDACIDCHRARQASIACNLCHELNQ